ncbi:MAG TPA: TetR/AcrR family transcriptional regulator [Longimicrobiaceae bacterium]|nr:TetR/AcrR family transcriptional regulator [Longimicrobiaceae bacterium]
MNNRTALLESALRLFAERGYDAVGVQEVCDAAGVTKPTLYHYFGSKRGLLETLVRERYAPFVERLAQLAGYTGDLPATLQRVVGGWFRFAGSEPRLSRLMLALWFASPASEAVQVVAPAQAEQRRILEELFARAAQDHGNMRGREQAYALTLLGMVHTYVGLALNGGPAPDDELVRRAVHQFSHGIYS